MSSCISVEKMKSLIFIEKKSHEEISEYLKASNPGVRGLSTMKVRRFCNLNGIRTLTALKEEEIKKEVFKCVAQVTTEGFSNII